VRTLDGKGLLLNRSKFIVTILVKSLMERVLLGLKTYSDEAQEQL